MDVTLASGKGEPSALDAGSVLVNCFNRPLQGSEPAFEEDSDFEAVTHSVTKPSRAWNGRSGHWDLSSSRMARVVFVVMSLS